MNLRADELSSFMPLYKEWNVGDHGLAAIWKIDEPESFFKDHTGIDPSLKNEKRRIEHLAGRYLLKHLEEDFPLLEIDKDVHDKPRIENNRYYFSISHSWPYVAAIIDPRNEAGIDIQTWHPRIERIQHKFLSLSEQQIFENDPVLITLAWCAKEAAYKWNGRRGVDFMEHLPIQYFNKNAKNKNIEIYFKLSAIPQLISLESLVDADFACSYVANAQDWAIY